MNDTYYAGVLRNPETKIGYFPFTLWDCVMGKTSFTGASATSNGTLGLVPAPSAGDNAKFLRGDGTWQTVSGGSTYTLPLASSSERGGIKIGYTTDSTNRNYAVGLSSEAAYVNVPWTDEKTKQVAINSSAYEYPVLLKSNANFNTETNHIRFITNTNYHHVTIHGTTGILTAPGYQIRNTSTGSAITDKQIIVGDGTTIIAPTGSNGDEKYLKATIGSNNAVSWSWATLSSGTAYSTTLNGASLPTSGSTSLGSWYAPTTAGEHYQLLMSNGSGAPSWFNLSVTDGTLHTGYLKFTANTGWSLVADDILADTKNTVGNYTGSSTSQRYSLVGVISNSNQSSSYAQSYCPNTLANVDYYGNIYSRYGSSNRKVVTKNGTGLTYDSGTTTSGASLELNTASSDGIGGIKVSATTAGTISSVASSGNYYPVQIDDNQQACVRVPAGSGSGTVTSIGVNTTVPSANANDYRGLVTGNGTTNNITTSGTIGLRTATATNGQGGLVVAADVASSVGYMNTDSSTTVAIPIFYGNIKNLKVFGTQESGSVFNKDVYVDGSSFTGHYVNIRDVVNGLVKDLTSLQILAEGLGIKELPQS